MVASGVLVLMGKASCATYLRTPLTPAPARATLMSNGWYPPRRRGAQSGSFYFHIQLFACKKRRHGFA